MKRVLFIAVFLISCSHAPVEQLKLREADYVRAWCTGPGMKIEARLADGTRVDCLTDTHAVEFDWASRWYAGVGQSLHYAEVSGWKPGMVLIVRQPGDARQIERARKVTDRHGIKLWVITELPSHGNL